MAIPDEALYAALGGGRGERRVRGPCTPYAHSIAYAGSYACPAPHAYSVAYADADAYPAPHTYSVAYPNGYSHADHDIHSHA